MGSNRITTDETKESLVTLAPERLDEIEARAKAATEGPWSSDAWAKFIRLAIAEDAKSNLEAAVILFLESGSGAESQTNKDAEFIAHARTDVPDLTAEVRRLQDDYAKIQAIAEEQGAALNSLVDTEEECVRLQSALAAARSETHELLADCYKALHEQYREAQPSYDMPPEPADEWSYKIVPLFVAIQRATGKNHDELIRSLPLDPDGEMT